MLQKHIPKAKYYAMNIIPTRHSMDIYIECKRVKPIIDDILEDKIESKK